MSLPVLRFSPGGIFLDEELIGPKLTALRLEIMPGAWVDRPMARVEWEFVCTLEGAVSAEVVPAEARPPESA